MSARIKATIKLDLDDNIRIEDGLSEKALVEALNNMNERYRIDNDKIIIDSKEYYYQAVLTKDHSGEYILTGDSDTVGKKFQTRLINEYKNVYIKEMKKKEIKKKKEKLLKKAKKMGYKVKEKKQKGKLKLQLVKRIY